MKSLCVLSFGLVVGLLVATPSSAPRVLADPFALMPPNRPVPRPEPTPPRRCVCESCTCCEACGKDTPCQCLECDCCGDCCRRAGVRDTAAGYHWRPILRHKDCHQLWLDAKILGWWDGREHGGKGAYFRLTDGTNGVESPLPWQIPAPVTYWQPQPAYFAPAPALGGACRS